MIAAIFAVAVVGRLLASFLVAWIIMLLLPAAGAPALGYSQVLAGTLIVAALSTFFTSTSTD